MGFRTSRLDLLNPQSSYNQLWLDYIDEFGDADEVVVVVRGRKPTEVSAALAQLAQVITQRDDLFRDVLHEVDLTSLRSKGLYYLEPQQLADVERFLDSVQPVLDGDWSRLGIGPALGGLNYQLRQTRLSGISSDSSLEATIDGYARALAEQRTYRSPWPEPSDQLGQFDDVSTHLSAIDGGRIGFVMLRLAEQNDQFTQGAQGISVLREMITAARIQHPHLEIGLTGLPVMEFDEMSVSQSDMIFASIASLLGVACLFALGFGGLRLPLVAVTTLLLAMAWSFGYITLSVGHLNILSVAFGVFLIGLGIDFGIHFLAQYLQIRPHWQQTQDALAETAATIGPGIVTGGVTTALAFFAAALTDFTGVVELGIIAGGGILLCIGAMLFVLPAMILLAERHLPSRRHAQPLQINRLLWPLLRWPKIILFATIGITIWIGTHCPQLQYDHNLLHLQPADLESVQIEEMLLKETDQSIWFAISIADSHEELLDRKRRFDQLGVVDRTEEIASLVPENDEARRPAINKIAQRLATLPQQPPLLPVMPIVELDRQLAISESLLGSSPAVLQVQKLRTQLARQNPSLSYQRLSSYQQLIAWDLHKRLSTLKIQAQSPPPSFDDLPKPLVKRFYHRGHYLLKIYGRGNIWDMQGLEKFVQQVKQIDPQATGQPLQTYYASRHMQRSYIHAAIYALIAVTIVLYLDFRSVRYTLLALGPVGIGTVQLFGLLAWLNIPLNPANMIVLPLILGIGIDDGVHVVHDFRRQKGNYRLGSSTAAAVLLTSLTTMLGFGSLILASHRGLQSLGYVLSIGVACCLATSLLILPAVLAWSTRNQTDSDSLSDRTDIGAFEIEELEDREIDGHGLKADNPA